MAGRSSDLPIGCSAAFVKARGMREEVFDAVSVKKSAYYQEIILTRLHDHGSLLLYRGIAAAIPGHRSVIQGPVLTDLPHNNPARGSSLASSLGSASVSFSRKAGSQITMSF